MRGRAKPWRGLGSWMVAGAAFAALAVTLQGESPALRTSIEPTAIGKAPSSAAEPASRVLGREVAVERHLQDGEEFELSTAELIAHGRHLFTARWTAQEGAGRPLSKGTGAPLSDLSVPLEFPHNFHRLSGPDANACSGCHNQPFGIPGGSGDVVTNAFVLAQRFDRLDFDPADEQPIVSSRDESGRLVTLSTAGNFRSTPGLFGAGYVEMVARAMTRDLQRIRDAIPLGGSAELKARGVSFGVLRRIEDGRFDTSRVTGLLPASLASFGGYDDPPSLVIRPFHQGGGVTSLREFTNNALNHHHGIQSSERFGRGADPDGDGFADEATRGDVTALVMYQATLAVPGRVIPRQREVERAVQQGEQVFAQIGCTSCHVPSVRLRREETRFIEPGPWNGDLHLQEEDAPPLVVDLGAEDLPAPRLAVEDGWVDVPVYSDFKLHLLTDGESDPNHEPVDMNQPAGLMRFFDGNGRFMTRRLWGVGNQPPYFHHGKFTTLREAIGGHGGEGAESRAAFDRLEAGEQAALIEFLKSMQVLPPGSTARIVDEKGRPRPWPPAGDGAATTEAP